MGRERLGGKMNMIGDVIKVLSTLSKLCLWFGVLSGVIYALTTYSTLELAIGSVALGVGLFLLIILIMTLRAAWWVWKGR